MHAPLWQHRVDRLGGLSTITLSGELDLYADHDVREALTGELRQPGLARLLVDMSAVTFIDSTVLSTLVYAHNAAHRAGHQFTISPSQPVRRILEITGYPTCSPQQTNSPRAYIKTRYLTSTDHRMSCCQQCGFHPMQHPPR